MFCPLSFHSTKTKKSPCEWMREIESLIIKNNDDTEKNVCARERRGKTAT